MQLVIDISEDVYNQLRAGSSDTSYTNYLCQLVRDGCVLPSEHGDLIDRSELSQDIYDDNCWRYAGNSPNEGYSFDQVANAKVVLKARDFRFVQEGNTAIPDNSTVS